MSDFASVVERTRHAFASLAKIEGALTRDPTSALLQVNLAASNKLAQKSRAQLLKLSEYQRIEVCDYRLLPIEQPVYAIAPVAKSLLTYQNLFSQVYDAKLNGPKQNAVFGREAYEQSTLEFAYSYSGSLGVILLAKSERDFFSGRLDSAIDTVFEILSINSRSSVREAAANFGNAVVKRLHNWTSINVEGGFSTDLQWNRSDGKRRGQVIEFEEMKNIADLIEATSDESTEPHLISGILVGGNIQSRTFHIIVPDVGEFRGSYAKEFTPLVDLTLGKRYNAIIFETRTTTYATDTISRTYELVGLSSPDETLL